MTDEDRSGLEAALTRLKKRFSVIANLDFFGASGREPASTLFEKIEFRLTEARSRTHTEEKDLDTSDLTQFRGRTWVTRKGVYVDRIACAWLIRRFIDPDASFRFVSERGYRPKAGELRFDMFE